MTTFTLISSDCILGISSLIFQCSLQSTVIKYIISNIKFPSWLKMDAISLDIGLKIKIHALVVKKCKRKRWF